MLKYLIFDLDNTLYSCNFGLEENVERRLMEFSGALLGVSPEEAWEQRKASKRGTCLEWLMADKGFKDVEAYFAAAHPGEEADSLKRDDELREMLACITLPKVILTNSPREHADRILDKLGIADLFAHIFDIRQFNFVGKPHKEVYEKVINTLGITIKEALFIDDVPTHVEGFQKLGGKAILLDEKDQHKKSDAHKIRRLNEIFRYIGRGANYDPSQAAQAQPQGRRS
ncbi:MAG: HAD-IA family hydrolase [Treponema sp.]|nr:HAD-IA family hydrolase [Treponema sp.]